MPVKTQKCLLIETKDHRKFFTHEKNFPQLIEFSKTFDATISLVKVEEAPILDLEELAPAICDAAYRKPKVEYQIVERKLAKTISREKMLKVAAKIREYIEGRLLSRRTVSLRDVRKRFARYHLSTAALCNHLSHVRRKLEEKGYAVEKVAGGTYCIK